MKINLNGVIVDVGEYVPEEHECPVCGTHFHDDEPKNGTVWIGAVLMCSVACAHVGLDRGLHED